MMATTPSIDVVIPAYNEEASLPKVLADIPPSLVTRVVVADNNSTDRTARVASEAGATVVLAKRQGYGSACLEGLSFLRDNSPPEIVVFVDADYSDHPEEMHAIVAPIVVGQAELVA